MLRTLRSMLTVFKHLFIRPVTLEYPEKKLTPPDKFRGMPVVKSCIGCHSCAKVCPTGAISITKEEFKIDLGKCIFCGNCQFYCPKGAIKMSHEYELASENKGDLELVYRLDKLDCHVANAPRNDSTLGIDTQSQLDLPPRNDGTLGVDETEDKEGKDERS